MIISTKYSSFFLVIAQFHCHWYEMECLHSRVRGSCSSSDVHVFVCVGLCVGALGMRFLKLLCSTTIEYHFKSEISCLSHFTWIFSKFFNLCVSQCLTIWSINYVCTLHMQNNCVTLLAGMCKINWVQSTGDYIVCALTHVQETGNSFANTNNYNVQLCREPAIVLLSLTFDVQQLKC